jgi:hypothetical protein
LRDRTGTDGEAPRFSSVRGARGRREATRRREAGAKRRGRGEPTAKRRGSVRSEEREAGAKQRGGARPARNGAAEAARAALRDRDGTDGEVRQFSSVRRDRVRSILTRGGPRKGRLAGRDEIRRRNHRGSVRLEDVRRRRGWLSRESTTTGWIRS